MNKINREPPQRGNREAVEDSREIREHLRITQEEADNVESRVTSLETQVDTLLEDNSAWGGLYVVNASTSQSIDTDYERITAFIGGMQTHNVQANFGEDILVVGLAGTYKVSFQVSFSGTPSREFEFTIFKDGAATNFGCHRVLGAGGDVGSASVIGIITCNVSTYIEVQVKASLASSSLVVVDAQLIVERMGD